MLTHEHLKELLEYDPATGDFHWLVDRRGRFAKKGARAGTRAADGRWFICIGGKNYAAHRLAWFYVNGEWPKGDIDHINVDPSDNRIANLRVATRSQNLANRRSFNAVGAKGVVQRGDRYRAYITARGHQRYLGTFDTADEAAAAYAAAANETHGQFARAS